MSFAQNTAADAVAEAERQERRRFEAACAALQGIYANAQLGPRLNPEIAARTAVEHADALLKELRKEVKNEG